MLSIRAATPADDPLLAQHFYLQSLGVTRVLLHASPFGRSVYASLGFVDNNEMRLDL